MAQLASMELDSTDDVFLQDDLGPTIAEHALQCNQMFRKCITAPEISSDPTLIDDQLARFALWTSNMDVFGPPNVSLDYRLRYSPTVVDIIHQLLDVIYNALTFLKPNTNIDDTLQTPTRKKRRTSDSGRAEITETTDYPSDDSDGNRAQDYAQRTVSLINYTIGGTVSQLLRLSNAIRRSSKTTRAAKISQYNPDEKVTNAISKLRHYTECYIRFRFPHATETLCSALIEANALRLRRLCYQRAHRKRVALSSLRPQTDTIIVQLPKMLPSATKAVHFNTNALPEPAAVLSKTLTTNTVPPAPMTHATTAQQTRVQAIYEGAMTEVPRAKSVAVNSKLSLPLVPKTSECPYCGVVLQPNGKIKPIAWSNHLMTDLEPFVCLFSNCTDLTFETSKAWINHMQNMHGHIWECRAPSHNLITFTHQDDFQQHSCTEHGVPEAYVATLSGAARRPSPHKVVECPFGDEFVSSDNIDSNAVFASEALQLHVATHMKEIALLALQKLPSDDDDDTAQEIASDAVSDIHDGAANLRGSMYSVLDDEALDFASQVGDVLDNEALDLVSNAEGSLHHEALTLTSQAKKTDDDSTNLEERITSSVNKLDLEDKDTAGMTVFHRAVLENNLSLVQSLIGQGVNVYLRVNNGKTALHYACMNQNLDIMRLILDSASSKKITNLRDNNGQIALHDAAKMNFVDGITVLVGSAGDDIELSDNHGLTPFLWAVIANNPDAIHRFLSYGIDVNSSCTMGKSALTWAASLGHLSIAELLLSKSANVMPPITGISQLMPLDEAAANGDVAMVSLLLNNGANPNQRHRDGWLAIHWAAEQGHLAVIKLLLQHGVDINSPSSYGTSVLHCAANGGHLETIHLLLQAGADASKSTCHGWTALHHAAYTGHHDGVKLLLKYSGVLNLQTDNHGWSPLHLAVHGRHFDSVSALLGHRLDFDENGLTAEDWLDFELDSHSYKTIDDLAFRKSHCCRPVTKLRQAARDSNIALVEYLLEQGYQANETDSGARTALYYAIRNGSMTIINLLLEKGANANILPTGRKSWESFISDEEIIEQLRRWNYLKLSDDRAIGRAIKAALKEQGKLDVSSLPESLKDPNKGENEEMANAEGTRRSSVNRLWKRLKGQ